MAAGPSRAMRASWPSHRSKTVSILAESTLSSTTRIRSDVVAMGDFRVLVARAGPAGQARDGGRQFGRVHGLDDVRLEAGEQCPFAVLRAGEGGQGNSRNLSGRVDGPHPANEIIPVRLGHANIAYDHVGAEPLDELQGLGG